MLTHQSVASNKRNETNRIFAHITLNRYYNAIIYPTNQQQSFKKKKLRKLQKVKSKTNVHLKRSSALSPQGVERTEKNDYIYVIIIVFVIELNHNFAANRCSFRRKPM